MRAIDKVQLEGQRWHVHLLRMRSDSLCRACTIGDHVQQAGAESSQQFLPFFVFYASDICYFAFYFGLEYLQSR